MPNITFFGVQFEPKIPKKGILFIGSLGRLKSLCLMVKTTHDSQRTVLNISVLYLRTDVLQGITHDSTRFCRYHHLKLIITYQIAQYVEFISVVISKPIASDIPFFSEIETFQY